ncbi:MAG: RuvX/YqgF family protein [Selenomonadaceae bacterium]|nr:RuvX/YqgF family protein [Selenomonadaceae bacterium]
MNKRIVALDVGDRRIGIAVSDPLGITAQPIGMVVPCRPTTTTQTRI